MQDINGEIMLRLRYLSRTFARTRTSASRIFATIASISFRFLSGFSISVHVWLKKNRRRVCCLLQSSARVFPSWFPGLAPIFTTILALKSYSSPGLCDANGTRDHFASVPNFGWPNSACQNRLLSAHSVAFSVAIMTLRMFVFSPASTGISKPAYTQIKAISSSSTCSAIPTVLAQGLCLQ